MNNKETKSVEEIAKGFESFDSFFAGLPMKDEKEAIKKYERYIQIYIEEALAERDKKIVEEIKSEINKYAIAVMETGSKEMSDVYIGQMKAIHDIETIINKLLTKGE